MKSTGAVEGRRQALCKVIDLSAIAAAQCRSSTSPPLMVWLLREGSHQPGRAYQAGKQFTPVSSPR
jgi:hypothetical protein